MCALVGQKADDDHTCVSVSVFLSSSRGGMALSVTLGSRA